MRPIWKGLAIACCAFSLGSCGLYIHDPSLQESAEKTRTLVSEADLSAQILQQVNGAQALGKRQEGAVLGFYVMRRNEQLLSLTQPDVLARGAFGDGTAAERAYVPKGTGFARDMAAFGRDVKQTIDCRLDVLLTDLSLALPTTALPSATVAECAGRVPKDRTRAEYEKLRVEADPALEFKNLRGLIVNMTASKRDFVEARKADATADSSADSDPRLDYTCDQIPEADRTAATTMPDTTTASGASYASFVLACMNLEAGLEASDSAFDNPPDDSIPDEEERPNAAATSLIGSVREQIAALQLERQMLESEGARLQAELRGIEQEIKAAAQPGKLEAGLAAKLEQFRGKLNAAHGVAQLASLHELADLTDELLQIELTEGAKPGSSAAAGTAAAETPSEIEKKGEAILRVTKAAASAIDAYSGNAPNARAQSLIIARVAVTQRIEVARLEANLLDQKLLLLRAQRRLLIDEVGHLANAALYLQHDHLKDGAPKAALTHLAAAWDNGRLQAEIVPYRILSAERETAIRISATNATHLQASVLAATDAIVAYSKGGLTKEAIADVFAKLFIGGALLK
ncbi:MAG TPA: hypothetical protein VG742_02900 [Dongiaceae bacterium]|nr:hypothetical protein [Dongiaceae bacterium]